MRILLLSVFFLILGCQTLPGDNVKASSELPAEDCVEIGAVTGTSNSLKGAREAAMKDLKVEASNKQANYVQIKTSSAHGGSVSGIAYRCD